MLTQLMDSNETGGLISTNIILSHAMIWYDIYSFAHGTTLSMKQSSDIIVK